MSENVEASTSRNPKGLHGLYRDNFTLSQKNQKGLELNGTSQVLVHADYNVLGESINIVK
jgi:hypothetical protein